MFRASRKPAVDVGEPAGRRAARARHGRTTTRSPSTATNAAAQDRRHGQRRDASRSARAKCHRHPRQRARRRRRDRDGRRRARPARRSSAAKGDDDAGRRLRQGPAPRRAGRRRPRRRRGTGPHLRRRRPGRLPVHRRAPRDERPRRGRRHPHHARRSARGRAGGRLELLDGERLRQPACARPTRAQTVFELEWDAPRARTRRRSTWPATVIELEVEIDPATLPAAVTAAIADQYPDGEITEAETLELPSDAAALRGRSREPPGWCASWSITPDGRDPGRRGRGADRGLTRTPRPAAKPAARCANGRRGLGTPARAADCAGRRGLTYPAKSRNPRCCSAPVLRVSVPCWNAAGDARGKIAGCRPSRDGYDVRRRSSGAQSDGRITHPEWQPWTLSNRPLNRLLCAERLEGRWLLSGSRAIEDHRSPPHAHQPTFSRSARSSRTRQTRTKVEIDASDLPASVLAAFNEQFPGAEIDEAEVEDEDGEHRVRRRPPRSTARDRRHVDAATGRSSRSKQIALVGRTAAGGARVAARDYPGAAIDEVAVVDEAGEATLRGRRSHQPGEASAGGDAAAAELASADEPDDPVADADDVATPRRRGDACRGR